MRSENTLTAINGRIYQVNWDDGIESFKESMLGYMTQALLSNQVGSIDSR